MNKIFELLNSVHGKKTYVVGIISALIGCWLMYQGKDDIGMQFLVGGAGMLTIRHAIAKNGNGNAKS